jgi:hypothetical protein
MYLLMEEASWLSVWIRLLGSKANWGKIFCYLILILYVYEEFIVSQNFLHIDAYVLVPMPICFFSVSINPCYFPSHIDEFKVTGQGVTFLGLD